MSRALKLRVRRHNTCVHPFRGLPSSMP
nr:hypothetical protein [Clostridia bacterium]